MKQTQIQGLSVGVVLPDNTIETAGWGIRSEQRDRMTVDVSCSYKLSLRCAQFSLSSFYQTLYDIGSCSKAFLTATLGILMDDFAQGINQTALPPGIHTFDWDTKVIELLPNDWRLMNEWASEKATLRDIMSHQSGLPR